MPLKPHPTDPDKMVYESRKYELPKRKWVGLTEDEIHECFEECCNLKVVDPKGGVRGNVNIFDVGRAIEAKLKEKNTHD